MYPAFPNAADSSNLNVNRLILTEIEISRHYQENMFKLETKYKLLIHDLIEDKMAIQQKLYQSFQTQMQMLSKIKLSILQDQQLQQDKSYYTEVKQSTGIINTNCKEEESDNQNEKKSDLVYDLSSNSGNEMSDIVDIPISIKNEESISASNESNCNTNSINQHIVNGENEVESQQIEYDIIQTKRMLKKTHNHITKILKTKNGEKYQCNDCNKKYARLDHIQNHIAASHISEKPFKCNQCDKCFSLLRLLNTHKHYHSIEYQCNICDKKFGDKSGLKRHERIHTAERPYKCEYNGCGKSFTLKNSLVKHQLIHSGEKPFKCDYDGCGKSFKRKDHLKDHERIHTCGKPFACDICEKPFRRARSMREHKAAIHSNDKPYKCDECDKCYSVKRVLTKHKNIHTSKYQCQICGKGHTCQSKLKHHMNTNHVLPDIQKLIEN